MRQSHCIRGHELIGRNVVMLPTGSRACRACRNIRKAAARRAAAEVKALAAGKPVVTPVAYRTVRDPWAAAIFGGGG